MKRFFLFITTSIAALSGAIAGTETLKIDTSNGQVQLPANPTHTIDFTTPGLNVIGVGGGGGPGGGGIQTITGDSGVATGLTLTVSGTSTNAVLTLGGSLKMGSLDAIPETKVVNLVPDLAAKANDAAVVHNTSPETINGTKTFVNPPQVPDGSFTIAKTANLQTTLDGKVPITRTITTNAPLTGGGDLSANLTLGIPAATNVVNGYMTSSDHALLLTALQPGAIGTTVQPFNANTTTQGNTFNGASQLVQLLANGKLPTLDGSNLTNLPAGSIPTGTGLFHISGGVQVSPATLLVNADVAAGANIDFSKINGSQRTISTTGPLAGGGDLSANRTLSILQATTTQDGYLAQADFNNFAGKLGPTDNGSGLSGLTVSQISGNWLQDRVRIIDTGQSGSEPSTLTIVMGDSTQRDATCSGTLTTINLTGTPDSTRAWEGRVNLVVSNAPQTITLQANASAMTYRRVSGSGTTAGGTVTFTQNGNHVLTIYSANSGASAAREYWVLDTISPAIQSNVDVIAGLQNINLFGTTGGAAFYDLANAKAASLTLAKMQNATANSKLLGSGSTGSGAPYAEITIGSGLTMSGTTLTASGGLPNASANSKVLGSSTTGSGSPYSELTLGTNLSMSGSTINAAAALPNASANNKIVGSGNTGSGSPYTEITLGTNLSMSGTTLNASAGSGSPGGALTNVQYYDTGGVFGGDANFTWDKTNHILGLGTGVDGQLQLNLPAQTTSAQPGNTLTIKAPDGQPPSTSGGADGGQLNLKAGSAQRTSTGNNNGGAVGITSGAGIGTGTAGPINFNIGAAFIGKMMNTGTILGANINAPTLFTNVDTATTTPRGILEWQISGTSGGASDTNGARVNLRRTRGTPGTQAIISGGDALGSIIWSGSDSTNTQVESSEIRITNVGTPASTSIASKMEFFTSTTATPSVKARGFQIDESQKLTIDKTIISYNGAAPTDGQILIGGTTNGDLRLATLTQGSNVSITNGNGTITIGLTGLAASATTDTTNAANITSGTLSNSRLSTGTGSSNVVLGGTITAGGPTGDSTHVPVITYNAAGQLTAVTTAAISGAGATKPQDVTFSTSVSDATSITPSEDHDITTQVNTQAAGTLTINAPTSGSSTNPVNGQMLIIRVKCTNAQTLSFNAIYRGSTDQALPTTTTANTGYMKFCYNSADTKWDLAGTSFGY